MTHFYKFIYIFPVTFVEFLGRLGFKRGRDRLSGKGCISGCFRAAGSSKQTGSADCRTPGRVLESPRRVCGEQSLGGGKDEGCHVPRKRVKFADLT